MAPNVWVGGWVGGGVGENSLGKQRKKHSERGRGREGELFPMTAVSIVV